MERDNSFPEGDTSCPFFVNKEDFEEAFERLAAMNGLGQRYQVLPGHDPFFLDFEELAGVKEEEAGDEALTGRLLDFLIFPGGDEVVSGGNSRSQLFGLLSRDYRGRKSA